MVIGMGCGSLAWDVGQRACRCAPTRVQPQEAPHAAQPHSTGARHSQAARLASPGIKQPGSTCAALVPMTFAPSPARAANMAVCKAKQGVGELC